MPKSRQIPNRFLEWVRPPLFITSLLLIPAIVVIHTAWAVDSRKVEKMIEDSLPENEQALSAEKRKQLLKAGETIYRKFCVHCHGPQGRGDGAATPYLSPQPRDLSSGIFKFHSTQNNALPVDEDLARTIRQGVPGTAMPPWGRVLNTQEIQSLIEYVKTFSGRFNREIPDYRIRVGMELPYDEPSVDQGKKLYRQMRCGRCHGKNGERSGPLDASLDDIWGHTSYVYDLRRPELYKARASGHAIYQTLVAGMDGTPMTAYDYLTEDERWHLVHYLQSKFTSSLHHEKQKDLPLSSIKISEPVTQDPFHPVWKQAPKKTIRLNPVQFRGHPIDHLQVQSIHNDHDIAFRLIWSDPQPDGAETTSSGYLDEAAIQFALKPGPVQDGPFYGMGERRKPVNIWHWKADISQAIIGNSGRAVSIRKENHFVNPFNESPVEELNASGFGSLYVQSMQNQQLRGNGTWKDGKWAVVFIRELATPSRQDIHFKRGNHFLLAFAVWDGANKDKNANKVVSFWKTLVLNHE